ncbi:MAG: YolD-like family protein [Ruminococcaceae bacterium]|nr:YolD-like family protein [Oscillospiraceae bacterium]
MQNYDDIIHLSRPESAAHPPMPRAARAAQFSAFAALTGYDAAIRETARLTDREIELDEDSLAILDARLQYLNEHAAETPQVTLTHFVPDSRKDGGAYRLTDGRLKQIDTDRQTLILCDGQRIPLSHILAVDSPLFAGTEYE